MLEALRAPAARGAACSGGGSRRRVLRRRIKAARAPAADQGGAVRACVCREGNGRLGFRDGAWKIMA
jgi:hypothetical protein